MTSKRRRSSTPSKKSKTTLKKVASEVRALKRETTTTRKTLYTFPIAPGADITYTPAYHTNYSSVLYVTWALAGAVGPNVLKGTKARLVALNYRLRIYAGAHNAEYHKLRFVWYVVKKNTTLTGVASIADILAPGNIVDAPHAHFQTKNIQIFKDVTKVVTPSVAAYASGGGARSFIDWNFTVRIPKKYQEQRYDTSVTGTAQNQICFFMASDVTNPPQSPYVGDGSMLELVYVDNE